MNTNSNGNGSTEKLANDLKEVLNAPSELNGTPPLFDVEVIPPVTYPTKPDMNGWFYADQQDADADIQTKIDVQEGKKPKKFKKTVLSGGETAIAKSLSGKHTMEAMTIAGIGDGKTSDNKKMIPAIMELSLTVNGQQVFVHELEEDYSMSDYMKMMGMAMSLNF